MLLRILGFILLIYLIYKFASFILRGMYIITGQKPPQKHRSSTSSQQGKKVGDVNIEYAPGQNRANMSSKFKGGDYVDYEEVK